jgi:DNA/RNA endonuclease YhcR with UshA esterase domain
MRTQQWLGVPVALVLAFSRAGVAQQTVIPDSAAVHHVGQTGTVEGTVVNVHATRTGTTFLNFGTAYPNQTFTAVIFRSAASRFPNPQQWEGKRVRVTGRVQLYRGRPEIILQEPSQLKGAP